MQRVTIEASYDLQGLELHHDAAERVGIHGKIVGNVIPRHRHGQKEVGSECMAAAQRKHQQERTYAVFRIELSNHRLMKVASHQMCLKRANHGRWLQPPLCLFVVVYRTLLKGRICQGTQEESSGCDADRCWNGVSRHQEIQNLAASSARNDFKRENAIPHVNERFVRNHALSEAIVTWQFDPGKFDPGTRLLESGDNADGRWGLPVLMINRHNGVSLRSRVQEQAFS